VVPVVLFHAGIQRFGGGFVGVDVFFVVSGYLITSLIVAERERGAFSLARFYERRARRILPALLLMVLASFAYAWFALWPDDLRELSKSALAISAFGSNFLFWLQSGYFAPAAETMPLLHTWTLAVEEQFYVAFPLLLLALPQRRLFFGLAAATAVGFAVAQWGSVGLSQQARRGVLPVAHARLGVARGRPARAVSAGHASACST
jgi:peptidoglycan/LPS O-acetylase OafA/YrhL